MARKKPKPPTTPSAASQEGPPGGEAPVSGVALAEQAIAPKADHRAIAERIEELTPEQAEMFVRILDITMKRRRLMLIGYLGALFALVFGMGWALYMYGTHEPGTFIGWVFLVPIAAAGLILWTFGRWAKRLE